MAKTKPKQPDEPEIRDPAHRLLTRKEAAAYLRVTTNWIKEAQFRGDLTYVRVGKFAMYRIEHLEQYIAANTINNSRRESA